MGISRHGTAVLRKLINKTMVAYVIKLWIGNNIQIISISIFFLNFELLYLRFVTHSFTADCSFLLLVPIFNVIWAHVASQIIFNSKKHFYTGVSTVLLRPAEWFNTTETKQKQWPIQSSRKRCPCALKSRWIRWNFVDRRYEINILHTVYLFVYILFSSKNVLLNLK